MAQPRAAVRAAGRRLMRRGSRGVRGSGIWQRLLLYLAILGPGMITANAGNDAGGIATFASVGAEFGYQLLWILIPITISLGIVQEMCARMGVVTGKGLADLIREQFGVRWTALVMLALLIANAGVTVSEFVGIAAATELFGIPRFISVPWQQSSSGGSSSKVIPKSRKSIPPDVVSLPWLHRVGVPFTS